MLTKLVIGNFATLNNDPSKGKREESHKAGD